MKERAKQICSSGKSYWNIVKDLQKNGISKQRARRMARHALQGEFLWFGVVEPLNNDKDGGG